MGLFKRKAVTGSDRSHVVADALSHATLRLDGPVTVMGSVAHTERIRALLAGRRVATVLAVLDPEVFQSSGSNGVAVHVDGHLVGHLPRAAADHYRAEIESTAGRCGLASVMAELRDGSTPSIVLDPTSDADGSR